MSGAAVRALHFLFLQGMPSPFFRRIAAGLEAHGCRTTGVNFCMGDRLFWGGRRAVNYRGSLADWPAYIDAFLMREGVTDLVLLGEQRRYHQEAIAAAQARGIRVTVTDFGYLRPDWITLERDGMSGNSRFPRRMDEVRRLAALAPKSDLAPRYSDSAVGMALGDLRYSFSTVLFWWLYPNYQRSDRRPHPILYFPAIGGRLLAARLTAHRARRQMAALLGGEAKYFVLPLQLEHDFQIISYSPFASLLEPLQAVIRSFAAHSTPGMRLVVKAHPWDPGLRRWPAIVRRLAAASGVGERVDYLDGGDLDEMLRAAEGMVTVNSSAGLQALKLGCPVKTLGQAIYDIPGLSYQESLDEFWRHATPPDPEAVAAFIDALAGSIQIRGVFFREPGLSAAVEQAVERLHTGTVGTGPIASARPAGSPPL
ncbi:MAG TPA: capsular biosynthesis protein [Steroidobacteraceae bacterium]|nr:capsular biosynthesis protein [Steroidobacteraceae bacterium]